MGQPAARVGDMHVCPMVNPGPVPHVGGPVLPPGGVTVLIGSVPAARVGDMCTCVGPPDTIAQGSTSVMICGQAAARMGDMTVHGGSITVGMPTVLIGTASGGGGGKSGGKGKKGSQGKKSGGNGGTQTSNKSPTKSKGNSPNTGGSESGQTRTSPSIGKGGNSVAGDGNSVPSNGISKGDGAPLNVSTENSDQIPNGSSSNAFKLGAKKEYQTLKTFGDATENSGDWEPEAKVAVGYDHKLAEGGHTLLGEDGGDNYLKAGAYNADAKAGYSFDALKKQHAVTVGVEGKASVVELQAKGTTLNGALEGQVNAEALSIEGKFNPLKAEMSPDGFSAVAEAGVEATLIKGSASGQINITPKTVYDNTLGLAVGLFSEKYSKMPAYMDHGVVIGAKGEAGIGAAAEAHLGVKSENGVTGISMGAKVGAGPMAGLKLFFGVK